MRDGRKKAQKAQKSDRIGGGRESVFAHFENGGAEIDQQAVFDAGGAEVAEELGDVFVVEGADGFEFDDELLLNEEVGEEFTEQSAVFGEDVERMLLNREESLFAEAMRETVFVDFFGVPVTEVAVEGEAGFADLVAELEDGVFHGEGLGVGLGDEKK
jgi:hypothetical protein